MTEQPPVVFTNNTHKAIIDVADDGTLIFHVRHGDIATADRMLLMGRVAGWTHQTVKFHRQPEISDRPFTIGAMVCRPKNPAHIGTVTTATVNNDSQQAWIGVVWPGWNGVPIFERIDRIRLATTAEITQHNRTKGMITP